MADDVTLQEAAENLGVHYMTAYRYVRLGLLPAEKEGTTWRVRRADLAAFNRANLPAVPPVRGGRKAPWAERFEARTVAGDAGGSWGVVEAALTAGMGPVDVYLDVIAPALTNVGERWARGELDVAAEHRASGIALRVLGRLGPRFSRRGRTRGSVVLGTPEGERHALPVAMLADLLRSGGWEVSDLGCDVPSAAFARVAADADRLVAVGVSVTNPACRPAAAATVAALRKVVGATPVLIGGHAVTSAEDAARLGADGWAPDGRAALATLDVLVGGSDSGDLAG